MGQKYLLLSQLKLFHLNDLVKYDEPKNELTENRYFCPNSSCPILKIFIKDQVVEIWDGTKIVIFVPTQTVPLQTGIKYIKQKLKRALKT